MYLPGSERHRIDFSQLFNCWSCLRRKYWNYHKLSEWKDVLQDRDRAKANQSIAISKCWTHQNSFLELSFSGVKVLILGILPSSIPKVTNLCPDISFSKNIVGLFESEGIPYFLSFSSVHTDNLTENLKCFPFCLTNCGSLCFLPQSLSYICPWTHCGYRTDIENTCSWALRRLDYNNFRISYNFRIK